MAEVAEWALLPAGFRDILPSQAAHEADTVTRLMAEFAARGYQRVKPPLIEFEDGLLAGSGAATAMDCFRVMDPQTHRMMAARADVTPQIARIAATRLIKAPRPLRLSYAGEVLKVKGGHLRPERQFGQAGIELIGAAAAAADAEVIVLMARALAAVGLEEVSVDLTVPTLVPVIVGGAGVGNGLRAALDHKDSAGVAELGGSAASLLCALIEAVGPAEQALARLRDLTLPAAAAAEWERLVRVVALVRAALPSLTLTIDPVENRGFEYHTGVAFTVFVRGYAGEVGRGGRYLAHGEPATGATLYTDSLLDVLPGAAPERRAFLPAGAEDEAGARLRALGWITVAGLDEVADAAAEAKRQNCGYLLVDGELVAVSRPPGG